MVLLWLASAASGNAQAVTAQTLDWLHVARALAQMHYLPGQLGWTGYQPFYHRSWSGPIQRLSGTANALAGSIPSRTAQRWTVH